jgi:hypothetical protein
LHHLILCDRAKSNVDYAANVTNATTLPGLVAADRAVDDCHRAEVLDSASSDCVVVTNCAALYIETTIRVVTDPAPIPLFKWPVRVPTRRVAVKGAVNNV